MYRTKRHETSLAQSSMVQLPYHNKTANSRKIIHFYKKNIMLLTSSHPHSTLHPKATRNKKHMILPTIITNDVYQHMPYPTYTTYSTAKQFVLMLQQQTKHHIIKRHWNQHLGKCYHKQVEVGAYNSPSKDAFKTTLSAVMRLKCAQLRPAWQQNYSTSNEDHHCTVAAVILKPSPDWKRPSGRPNQTWLRAI